MRSTVPEVSVRKIALVAAFNPKRELLLLKRPDEAHCGGLWSLPGGKIEDNEEPLAAAQRELHEETGLVGESWIAVGQFSHAYDDRHLQFHLFACRCVELAGFSPESESAWASRCNLNQFPMPAANALVPALLALPEVDRLLSEQ